MTWVICGKCNGKMTPEEYNSKEHSCITYQKLPKLKPRKTNNRIKVKKRQDD